ncbi:MAG: hypothetical protein K2X27_00450 [Candidatus Obscuribacterales bacterium]|nr:hypothetical protein [Candidatus Obscuribacterales bacterium]
MYLTLCSTRKVQTFIFNSSKLVENIGASYLVAQSLSGWLKEALPAATNVLENGLLDEKKNINSGIDAEVIYSGGGNSLIIFGNENLSKEFGKTLSRLMLERAPGLEMIIVGHEFSAEDSLFESMNALHRKLKLAKEFSAGSSPLSTISVTASGSSGANPAIAGEKDFDGKECLLDAETIAKTHAGRTQLGNSGPAEKWLNDKIPLPGSSYAYSRELNELGGKKGEFSYIAVIHADADDMGNRIMKMCEKFRTPDKNQELISSLRKFSMTIEESATGALKEAVDRLVKHAESQRNGKDSPPGNNTLELGQDPRSGRTLLPLRPLIIGGDDITIVCDARIAHSFAQTFISAFERLSASLPDGEGGASMSAGIAIVKSHYPFARAYALAKELTRSAKLERKKREDSTRKHSFLDWAVMQSGVLRSLSAMREYEYLTPEGSLCLRPVSLKNSVEANDYRTWAYVEHCVREFQSDQWSSKRNKVKDLRDSLREGRASVEDFRKKFLGGGKLPEIAGAPDDFSESGWYGKHCAYFDALELMDFFISIDQPGVN